MEGVHVYIINEEVEVHAQNNIPFLYYPDIQ